MNGVKTLSKMAEALGSTASSSLVFFDGCLSFAEDARDEHWKLGQHSWTSAVGGELWCFSKDFCIDHVVSVYGYMYPHTDTTRLCRYFLFAIACGTVVGDDCDGCWLCKLVTHQFFGALWHTLHRYLTCALKQADSQLSLLHEIKS